MLPVQKLISLPWFKNAKGIASLVADAMEGGAHTLSDVAAALQASHLLVWQHEVEHGEALQLPACSPYICMQSFGAEISQCACQFIVVACTVRTSEMQMYLCKLSHSAQLVCSSAGIDQNSPPSTDPSVCRQSSHDWCVHREGCFCHQHVATVPFQSTSTACEAQAGHLPRPLRP